MKKIFLLTALAGMFAWSTASAQVRDPAMSGAKLGIGADFAFPTGNTGDVYKLGYGGSLEFQTPIADRLNFTASAGYLTFTGKEYGFGGITIKARDFSAVPVKVGIKYFLAENFYAGGQVGASFGTSDGAGTAFAYTPGIGVEFPVADKGSIDLGARYEGWSAKNENQFVPVKN
ncbi:outer membrane beta-barrel protein, partial [Pedobacter antarcticus]